jgi:hypothetical protein
MVEELVQDQQVETTATATAPITTTATAMIKATMPVEEEVEVDEAGSATEVVELAEAGTILVLPMRMLARVLDRLLLVLLVEHTRISARLLRRSYVLPIASKTPSQSAQSSL